MPRVKGIETTRRGGRRKRKRCSSPGALQTNEESLLCSTTRSSPLGVPASDTTPLTEDNDSNNISFLSPAHMANTHVDSTIITPSVRKDYSRRSASGVLSSVGMDHQTESIIMEHRKHQPDQAAIHAIQRKTAAELAQETDNIELQRVVLYDNHVSSPKSTKVESVQKLFEDCIKSRTGPLPEAIVAFIAAELVVLTTTHPGWILSQNGLEGIHFVHDNSGKWTLRYRSSAILESIPEDKCNKLLSFMIVETVALLLLGIGRNDECKIDLAMLKSHICDNWYIHQRLAWAAAFEALEHGHRDTAISMLDNNENFIKSAAFLDAMDGKTCSVQKGTHPLDMTPTKLGHGDCNTSISMLDSKDNFTNSAAFLDALDGKSYSVPKGAKPVDMTPTKLFGNQQEKYFDFSKKALEVELEKAKDLVKLYESVLLLPETADTLSCNSESSCEYTFVTRQNPARTSGESNLQKGSVVKEEMDTFATPQNPAKYGRLLITIDSSDDESECEV